MSTIDSLLESVSLPRVIQVSQGFDRDQVDSIKKVVSDGFAQENIRSRFKAGMSVALTVGSRGIADLPELVVNIIGELKSLGTLPFIVPAMGSHGGGTAEGQRKILADMGITEESSGVPIVSSLDTVHVATTDSGLPVFMDKQAFQADATVVLNRIHPHVAFRGTYESGLMKMIAIGLGKLRGANVCHDLGFGQMTYSVPEIGDTCIKNSNICLGIAVLENAYHKIHDIQFLPAEDILEAEPGLLEKAKSLEPCLYIKDLDVLIIEEIGKNISGSGFDTNIVGRYGTPFISGGPTIKKMGILDVTDVSHGNCTGVGMAEFTTRKLFDKFSFEDTYPNSLTATVQTGIRIPMVLKNDKQVFQAAVKTSNVKDKKQIRLIVLKNTLKINQLFVSESLVDEVERHPNMSVLGEPKVLQFDDEGNLQLEWERRQR